MARINNIFFNFTGVSFVVWYFRALRERLDCNNANDEQLCQLFVASFNRFNSLKGNIILCKDRNVNQFPVNTFVSLFSL